MHPSSPSASAVDAVIASRRSIRAFRSTPVPRETVEAILAVAARAPSGANTQPWKVIVLAGAAKEALSTAILAVEAQDAGVARPVHGEYDYYPKAWVNPYLERRRTVGWDLYGLLGITRNDKARMRSQHARNYEFFGAPVGLIFTIDRVLCQGSWLDYGMFLQNIMLAARARGLDTCPQAAFISYFDVIHAQLGIPDTEAVVCGMALGYADPDAPENRLVTSREPVAAFTRFVE